jgi:hypothetical protein
MKNNLRKEINTSENYWFSGLCRSSSIKKSPVSGKVVVCSA